MLKHLIQRIRGTAERDPNTDSNVRETASRAKTKANIHINEDAHIDVLPPTLTDQVADTDGGTPIHVPVFSPSAGKPKTQKSQPRKQPKESDVSGLPFMIRPAEASEISALSDVFIRAIEGSGKRDYDPAQIAAWTSKAHTPEFNSALSDGVTILAEHHDQPIAFAQLSPNDCIRMLYVDPEWASLGIATLMCQYLEDEARILGSTRLTTSASHTAKRFFESMGFKTEQEESVEINGVALTRTKMEKRLVA